MPKPITLTIPQGSEWGYRWPITPAPTGGSARAQVRPSATSPVVLHEWSTAAGNATVGPEGVTLECSPATSAAFTWRRGVFDVEYTDADGSVYRIAQGRIRIDPEITRTNPGVIP
ncbi:MAG: hypothetical protein ACRCYU_12165 [Nocardioides sp.]